MRRGKGFTLGLGIVGIGSAYLIYLSIQRKKLFNKIHTAIGGTGATLSSYDVWFDPNYWNDPSDKQGDYKFVDYSKVVKWADDIDWSWGTFDDSETRIYSVFRAIPDGVALSQVSQRYAEEHGSDLKEDISGLDDDEVRQVAQILEQKPAYRPI